MAVKNVRVDIPKNPTERLKLSKKVYQKHLADGADSSLKSLKDYKWEETGPTIDVALQKDEEARAFLVKAEEAFKERDKYVDNITKSLLGSRDLLLAINIKNQKVLGNWGYVVHDAVKPKRSKVKTTGSTTS